MGGPYYGFYRGKFEQLPYHSRYTATTQGSWDSIVGSLLHCRNTGAEGVVLMKNHVFTALLMVAWILLAAASAASCNWLDNLSGLLHLKHLDRTGPRFRV